MNTEFSDSAWNHSSTQYLALWITLAVVGVAAHLAACSPSPDPPLGPVHLEIGRTVYVDGWVTFVPLEDGDALSVVLGLQGAHMVELGLSAPRLADRLINFSCLLSGPQLTAGFTFDAWPLPATGQLVPLIMILDWLPMLEGQEATVRCSVASTDDANAKATEERRVVLLGPPEQEH